MEFYYLTAITYHNETKIGAYRKEVLCENTPKNETFNLTWNNLDEWYIRHGLLAKFTIWYFKKGRVINFFENKAFLKKDERDIKEWKHDLNIKVEIIYEKKGIKKD